MTIKRQWEDENGKWIEQEDGSILHTEQSQKWKDENPPNEPEPQPPSEIELLKQENKKLKAEDLNNKEAIAELHLLMSGGI